ncbi:hypothetical protein [Priestia endophytica]|uniref:hypothetical protein n=1 Tax=Priestia endophytica TaxID=135735 RepID=UPI000DCA8391|nr:hypothetical protein [Priestia endophytica]RAS85724.1 hypothetical protein A4U60_09270 [Priestia endophytica]
MQKHSNKVAWCSFCDQGWVEICKDKKTKELFVACDECGSRWEHPVDTNKSSIATTIFDEDTEVEILEPTEKEIALNDWKQYILDSY